MKFSLKYDYISKIYFLKLKIISQHISIFSFKQITTITNFLNQQPIIVQLSKFFLKFSILSKTLTINKKNIDLDIHQPNITTTTLHYT